MKITKTAVILLGLLFLLSIAACAPKAEPSGTASQPAVNTASPTDPSSADSAAPTMDMKAFIAEKVAGNHDLDRIFNAKKTREEWNTTLDRMIGYGAKINEQEKQQIIDYLLSLQ